MDLSANILLTLLVLQLGWQYVFRFGRDTIGNDRVPTYYQNHGIREVILAAALAMVIIILTWTAPTLSGLVMLTLCSAAVVGCYWIAVIMVGLGRQFEEDSSDDVVPHINHAIQVVLVVIALTLKWVASTPFPPSP